MSRLTVKPSNDTADKIKRVARQLFAERGVDGVSVRDIAEASGQKNHAAVAYHFGSKEELVRELVLDGAKLIDLRRNQMLDKIEAADGPGSLLEIVNVLIYPSIDFGEDADVSGYNRFVFLLGMTHREFFLDALENRWNSGYVRCLEHLRNLMPQGSQKDHTRKLVFVGQYLGAVLAARESTLEDRSREHPIWDDATTLEMFAETMVAILMA